MRKRVDLLPRAVLVAVITITCLVGPAFCQEQVEEPLPPVPVVAEQVSPPPQVAPITPTGITPFEPSLPPTDMPPIGLVPAPPLPPDEPPPPEDFITLRADVVRVVADNEDEALVTAVGNVTAWYRDLVLRSERGIASTRTRIATFDENVEFFFQGQVARGERLTLNMDTGEWTVETAATALTPEFFRDPQLPIILAPIFLSGATIFGEDARRLTVSQGAFTTCNLDPPHYSLEAREVTIIPGDRLIARDVTFNALGRRLIRLPRLAIPLRRIRERPDIIPRIGQSADEGIYIKGAYDYQATSQHTGTARVDLMSRKGFAQGLTHIYNLAGAVGEVYLYRLADRTLDVTSLTGRLRHQQQFGTIQAIFGADLRDNNYQYAPGTTSTSQNINLLRNRPGASTRLDARRNMSRGATAFGAFETISSTFLHRQDLDERTTLNVGANLSQSISPVTAADGNQVRAATGQINSRLEFLQRRDRFDWGFNANWITSLTDEEIFGPLFRGITRQPELTLRTSALRLGRQLPLGLGADVLLAVGRYREEPGRIETERAVVEINSPTTRYNLDDRTTLTAGAGFRQYAYGDETAQYAINTNAILERRIGDNSSAALTYRYLRPRGFTPFRFDFIGRTNVLSGRFNLRETDRFTVSLLTGYDLRLDQNPWQDATIRVFYSPTPALGIYTSTGYDINRSRWRSIVNQFRIRLPNDFRMDIGSRYDTLTDRFSSIRGQIDTPIGRWWRLQGTAGWNGFTRSFDYRSVMLTRDLHCWEASLVFTDQSTFFQQRDIMLNLRIKAFPIFEQFGVGAFGQALDTSVGDIY